MKVNIEINTEKNTEQEIHNLITAIYNNSNNKTTTNTQIQQKINNNKTTEQEEYISIVVRDGENKTTKSVKEELKKMGFNFKTQNKKGESDPRWTLTCIKNYWDNIKENNILTGLNIWTTQGGTTE